MTAPGSTIAPSLREQRRAQHQELSRGQILDAAEEVFARKGFHDATIKEIAALAEFSVGAVYNFFASKNDVFVQIVLRRGVEFMEAMRATLGEPGQPLERLHRLADFQVGFYRQHPNFGRLLLRASGVAHGDLESEVDQAVGDNYAEAMSLQARLFSDGQEAGELRAGDPEVLAHLFSGLVSGYQATDPLGVGDDGDAERLPLAAFHTILDGAFAAA